MEAAAEESEELVEISLNHQGDDYTVVVDLETANSLLNDPEAAGRYMDQVLAGEANGSVNENQQEELLWTKKKPTDRDNEATTCFLQLREKYASLFDDKKHTKNQIWAKINQGMKEMGFNVGEGRDAIEKLRQKFANLQKQYLKYIGHVKTTGESRRDPPPFYSEMHSILGGKDKCNPKYLEDTLSSGEESEEKTGENSTAGTREDVDANKPNVKEVAENRFSVKRTGKPSNSVSRVMQEQCAADREERKEQFQSLENILMKQNEQRERLLDKIDILINQNERKRKHSESD